MYYEVKVRGNATNPEDGCVKPAMFSFLVEGAQSHGEAESAALEFAVSEYAAQEVSARAVKISNVSELFTDSEKEKFYRCKVITTIFDGKKEAKTKIIYLVSGNSAVDADKFLKSKLDGSIDFEISDISETKISDVVTYHPSVDK